ncbi:MAG: putative esterase [Kiritimatiellia bacterium]|jgi:predicted esterase
MICDVAHLATTMIKHVITTLCVLLLSPALLSGSEAVSFGTPDMALVKTSEKGGRKILRYEHDSIPEWGYAKPQQDYFNVLSLAGNPGQRPLHVVLHSAGGSADAALDRAFDHPDWFHFVGLKDHVILYLDCRKNDNDWWWGAHAIRKDKEKYADAYCPAEKRILTTIEWAIQTYKIDRNRVYLSGISMGGSGSLGIGMRRGDIFAAVNVMVPAGIEHIQHRMFGQHVPDPPILVNFSATNDKWSKGQETLIAYFDENRFPLVFAWGPHGHNSSTAGYHPSAQLFPWRSIRKNEAYPVFSSASADNKYPVSKNATGGDESGQVGALFRWKTITDTPGNFHIDLRLVNKAELEPALKDDTDLPTTAHTAVSFRRLQRFKTEAGKSYPWSLSREGKTLQSGTAKADESGLLAIEKLHLSVRSARLKVQH